MAFALILGVGVSIALIHAIGARAIAGLVLRARWWLPVVVALHLPQTFCSALGWRSLLARPTHPSFGKLYVYRWIRESVNSILPVAQVGGDVVRARLLAQAGTSLKQAGASCVLDVTFELLAQVVFTLMAFALLLGMVHNSIVERSAVLAILALAATVIGLFLIVRAGASGRLWSLASRFARRSGLAGTRSVGEPPALYRPGAGQMFRSTLWHLLSWLFGVVETFAGLRALGLHASLRQATVVEGVGQIVRTAGFAVPGALGVQEGGLVLVCGLLGIAPASAIALSLLRRIRELALGLPGLVVWHRLETLSRRP